MAKDKTKKGDRKKKTGKKASQFAIRVEKSERDGFVALCERLDTSAAREIRRFMRDFVARHGDGDSAPAAEEPAPQQTPGPQLVEPAAPKATRVRKPRTPRAQPEAGAAEATTARARKPRAPRAATKTSPEEPGAGARKPRTPAGASDTTPMAPPRRPRATKSGGAPATKRQPPGRPPKPAE